MSQLTELKFQSVEPKSKSPGYQSISNSLKVISASTGAQQWEFTLISQLLPLNQLRRIWAEINAIYGNKETFEQVIPIFSTTQGVVTGIVKPAHSYAKGSYGIEFLNFKGVAGDFLRFSGHTKVYQIRKANLYSAEIYPPLLKSVSSSEVITVQDVPFKVRLAKEPKKFKIDKKQMVRIGLPCVEDI